ncbi:PREDICTED: acid-sensing ion channel 4-like [Amphimedon queenslandica]|uniref:Uncharacterized protein n=1 Tax=Amphimedon queenslandica TaxID=400682 RepID=A0A1X7V336_AMPQE|nr:PREDICTED: acid-sensing ion channel 4-like [Amphimedon queenslandica]|eukprot:XP_011403359.1 PREDICTED: acid-sensing ion channel 4-like [Amphimedon queenslandica]
MPSKDKGENDPQENTGVRNRKEKSCQNPQFTKWAESSTIHGVDHIFLGKSKVRRVVWAVILLLAIGGCLYGIIDRSIYFASKPTATTVTADINEDGIPFPAVTICNLSPISRQYADQHNLTSLLSYILFTDSNTHSKGFISSNCQANLEQITDTTITLKDVFRDGARNSSFILACHYGSARNKMDCANMTLRTTLTPRGLCYTFNGDPASPPLLVRSVGERFGLRMIFNISQSDYTHSINGDAGIRVSVHTRDEKPDPLLKGISVPPRSHASIALYPIRSISKPEITRCAPTDTQLSYFPGLSYTTSGCQANEHFERSQAQCGCVDVAESATNDCTVEDICCLYDEGTSTDTLNSTCLPSCNNMIFSSSVSYSQYPSDVTVSLLTSFQSQSAESIDDNILALNIYFGSLHTIVTSTYYTYLWSGLLADIGGQLALFVGASVISFMELVLLCFDETKCSGVFIRKKIKKKHEEHELEERDDKESLNGGKIEDKQANTNV